MTEHEMIAHNKRVIKNITDRREKANLELENFFASKVDTAPVDKHNTLRDLFFQASIQEPLSE